MIGLGVGIDTTEVVLGGVAGFPAFSFQSMTNTLAASHAVAPTAARKRGMDRLIRRVGSVNAWPSITGFYVANDTEDAFQKNWKTPGTFDLTKVGAPTFTANDGFVAAVGGYYNTGIAPDSLPLNNCGLYVYCDGIGTSANQEAGAVGAGGTNGMTVGARTATHQMNARGQTALVNVSAANTTDGVGFHGWSRNNSANFTASRNAVSQLTSATASVASTSQPIFWGTLNSNGTPSASISARKQKALVICNAALTNVQEKEIYGAIAEWLDSIFYGEPIIETVGIGSGIINVSGLFYGFTMASVIGAVEYRRAGGPSAVIVGGWRDRWNLAGETSGGLGLIDIDDLSKLGGLPRWALRQCNLIEGVADTTAKVRPRTAQQVARMLLNPATNGGFTINLYQTNGVVSAAKTGAKVTSIATTDGRTFNLSVWQDNSYEQDLCRAAGITMIKGREAAGAGLEANNGVLLSATNLNFQPWVVADTPASGLIPNVQGVRTTFGGAVDTVGANGTADSHIQSYNFRMSLSNVLNSRVPLPTSPPAGYVESNYEFVMRYLAGNATVDTFAELFKTDVLYNNVFDVNNLGFVSSDYMAGADAYPSANYAARETIWQAHQNYLLGFIYLIGNSVDARVPAGLKTDVAAWGWSQTTHLWPHENDFMWFPGQLYVRECWRMAAGMGGAFANATDEEKVDGTAPRISTNTASTIIYQTDSHAVQRAAFEASAGNWQTRNDGGFAVATGGVDLTTPVPIEIGIPPVGECTNGCTTTGTAGSHAWYGAYRMETTMWMMAQSLARAMAMAAAGDGIIQNINMATWRTNLLASATLSGETAPILPQVN